MIWNISNLGQVSERLRRILHLVSSDFDYAVHGTLQAVPIIWYYPDVPLGAVSGGTLSLFVLPRLISRLCSCVAEVMEAFDSEAHFEERMLASELPLGIARLAFTTSCWDSDTWQRHSSSLIFN